MSVFFSTSSQMLFMLFFISIGFILKKRALLPDSAPSVLSKMENLIFMPCLVLNTFIHRCTLNNLKNKAPFLLFSFGALALALLLALIFSPIFSKKNEEKGVFFYSFSVSNIAFMGNAVVEGVFGEEVLFDYLIFTLPINLFIYSIGISRLMPKNTNDIWYKNLINPSNVATIVGILLGICAFPLPDFLSSVIAAGGVCMSPIAMLLTGFVIGCYDIRQLLLEKRVYLLSFYRLILMPLAIWVLLQITAASPDIQKVTICAYAMPLGLNTIVVPAAYGGDTTLGASMALISNILAVITVPLIFGMTLP